MREQSELILHIGHGKTGTSYLQSLFAINSELLREHGINYPANNTFQDADKGLTTSGNGKLIFDERFSVISLF